MVPLNSLSRLLVPSRTQLKPIIPRSLTTSEGRLKKCEGGGSKRRDPEDICLDSQPCKSAKKKKVKMCDKMRHQGSEDGHGAHDLPEMCSRQAMLDCARKLEELQKHWEAMARTAERMETAAARAKGDKRVSGCPVKAPAQPEKQGSSVPIVLTVLAVIAGVAYYLYTQGQEGEGGEGEDKEKKDE